MSVDREALSDFLGLKLEAWRLALSQSWWMQKGMHMVPHAARTGISLNHRSADVGLHHRGQRKSSFLDCLETDIPLIGNISTSKLDQANTFTDAMVCSRDRWCNKCRNLNLTVGPRPGYSCCIFEKAMAQVFVCMSKPNARSAGYN